MIVTQEQSLLLAGPVEISTDRGANILFHAIYFFNINVFIEL